MSNELSIRDIQLELATTIADISAVRWVTDSSMIRYRPGPAGKEYAYVPNQFAIMELNRLFHGHWSYEVLSTHISSFYIEQVGRELPWMVEALCKLTINCYPPVIKMQVGRHGVTYYKRAIGDAPDYQRPPLDIGNDIKAAISEALPKCCSQLGIFGDIYGQREE